MAGCTRTEGASRATVVEGIAAPPRADRVACTADGIALLTADALVLHDRDGAPRERIAVGLGLGLCVLGSGALLALARASDAMVALRVRADGQTTRHPTRAARAREPICLLPDPADEEGFWSITPEWDLAQRHTLRDPDTALRVTGTLSLEPGAATDALPQPDGALLLATGQGLASAPGPLGWKVPGGSVSRLAAAGAGRAWVLGRDGGLRLVSLDGEGVVFEAALGGTGLALAADAGGVVALTAARGATEAVEWTLHACDAAGTVRWTAAGSDDPGLSLALGPDRVALSDGEALAVWERAGGTARRGP